MEKIAVCSTPMHYRDLKTLLEHQGKPALSIYLPRAAHCSAGQHFEQLLQEAGSLLEESELDSQDAARLLSPLRDLRRRGGFLQQAAEGLAMYVSSDSLLYYFPAVTDTRRLVIDDYFYVLPLITHSLTHKIFYILDLNGADARLYQASQVDIRELPLAAAPGGTNLELPDRLAALAREMKAFTRDRFGPLLVVCRESGRFEQFRDLLVRAGLQLECHHCAADSLSLQRLHQRAWHQLGPLLQNEQHEALRSYQALQNTSKILQDVVAVTQAAYNSRVEKLFLVAAGSHPGNSHADNSHVGMLSPETPPATHSLAPHPTSPAMPGARPVQNHVESGSHGTGNAHRRHHQLLRNRRHEELLNRATIYTYLNGGEVYSVRPEDLAGAEQAAAILRY